MLNNKMAAVRIFLLAVCLTTVTQGSTGARRVGFVAELYHSIHTYAFCVKCLLYVKVTNMTMGNVIDLIDFQNSEFCSKTIGFQFCWELVACLRFHSLNDIDRPSPRGGPGSIPGQFMCKE
jgi:hypothetical protein